MHEQPEYLIETPAIFSKLEDMPNVWVKRQGVFFKGSNGLFRTDPPLYNLMGIYKEVPAGTPGSEKMAIFDPETFEPIEHWFSELPNDNGAFIQKLGCGVGEQVG